MLDQLLLDDMERVDVEGEIENSLVASKATPPHTRTPVAAARNRRTNSSG